MTFSSQKALHNCILQYCKNIQSLHFSVGAYNLELLMDTLRFELEVNLMDLMY